MIFAISGTQNNGKTTLIKDLMETGLFDRYDLPDYRDVIKSKGLNFNQKADLASQQTIFDCLEDNVKELAKRRGVFLMDRSPLDAYVYTRYMFHSMKNITLDTGLEHWAAIKDMEQRVRKLPIVTVFLPLCNIPIVDDGFRDTDPEYRKQIDYAFRTCLLLLKGIKVETIETCDRVGRVEAVKAVVEKYKDTRFLTNV